MNSPYMGNFYISQGFTLGIHDGLDLVGQDSKEIHSTVNGIVIHADWENPNDHSQGFGKYVCIKGDDGKFYYFGHLAETAVCKDDRVKITDIIGIEGSTGYSTGSHCHYEIRGAFYKGARVYNVCEISGIPNNPGGVYNDGFTSPAATPISNKKDVIKLFLNDELIMEKEI